MISTKTIFKEKQELVLPSEYSDELAEETGIHIGDGCMNIYKKHNANAYVYSGHAVDDLEFSRYVKHLMKKLYNLSPSYERIQKNTILISYTRKKLIQFKQKLGLPLGSKKDIDIPQWIINNERFKISCIKGIFATDGCLQFQKKQKKASYYPQLKITSKSKVLIDQINFILYELDIKSSISVDKTITPRHPNKIWNVYIYGINNLKKFIKIVGFSNPKHLKIYKEWK